MLEIDRYIKKPLHGAAFLLCGILEWAELHSIYLIIFG